jgi:arginyl-tRNA--protein-N-Asp/Glu arginylyltransferase
VLYSDDPNNFRNYLDQYDGYEVVGADPQGAHKYTISLHKAIYTQEFFEVYKRYEQKVHKKERKPSDVKTFLCNSPVFDPQHEEDQEMMNSH